MEENKPEELAEELAKPSSWGSSAETIEYLQTHISHVFLVGEKVFKLRKAVRLPFLDFGTREARNLDCLHEVELNRRLAPSVYLGIAPIIDRNGKVEIGPIQQDLTDAKLEHVVVMRRLPPNRDALALLDQNLLGPAEIDAIATRLAQFHLGQSLGKPAPWSPEGWLERTAKPIHDSLTTLRESQIVPNEYVDLLSGLFRRSLSTLEPALETRRLEGRAIDAHGDLHLDHVWFEPGETSPLLIDCLEFNEDLRKIDSASEMAFLAMDLRYRGRPDLAEWLLGSYASQTDDFSLFSVVDLFSAYRALVRAKVAALAACQSTIPESQRASAKSSAEKHLELTESCLTPQSLPGIVVLCGTVGSGKSSVARHLAKTNQGIPISSDRVRKAIAGISTTTRPQTPTATDQGLYDPANREGVYRALLERAVPVVESGRVAILDASFSRRIDRDVAREWAEQRRLPARLIEVRCDKDEAIRRLTERARAGTDPSDAGPDFLTTSTKRFEAPLEWPEADRQVIYSTDSGWEDKLR